MTTATARPAIDLQLQGLLSSMPDAPPLNEETLEMIRPYATLPVETALAGRTVASQEISIASFDGTQIVLTILSPAGADLSAGDAPGVYWVHGGGMVRAAATPRSTSRWTGSPASVRSSSPSTTVSHRTSLARRWSRTATRASSGPRSTPAISASTRPSS